MLAASGRRPVPSQERGDFRRRVADLVVVLTQSAEQFSQPSLSGRELCVLEGQDGRVTEGPFMDQQVDPPWVRAAGDVVTGGPQMSRSTVPRCG